MNAREIHKQGAERALKALALRRQGLTFREIGEQIGPVCIERARQIVENGRRIETRRAEMGKAR